MLPSFHRFVSEGEKIRVPLSQQFYNRVVVAVNDNDDDDNALVSRIIARLGEIAPTVASIVDYFYYGGNSIRVIS